LVGTWKKEEVKNKSVRKNFLQQISIKGRWVIVVDSDPCHTYNFALQCH